MHRRGRSMRRLIVADIRLCFQPVLVLKAFTADPMLIELIGPSDDLWGKIDRLLHLQRGFCRIEDTIGKQLDAIIHQRPHERITPDKSRPFPAEWRHEEAIDRNESRDD